MLTATELDQAATPAQLPEVGVGPEELVVVGVVEVVEEELEEGEVGGGGAEALPVRAFLAAIS